MRIGFVLSHPIQYYSPWFRQLAGVADLIVLYAHRASPRDQAQAGFGVAFDWDIDLLAGYKSVFLRNVAKHPSTQSFFGCNTPSIRGVIRELECDAFCVIGWNLLSYWQAIRACRQTGTPVLSRGDSQLRAPTARWKRLCKEITHRFLLRQYDGHLSVGQRHTEYLVHYGAGRSKIYAAPHFVDTGWFRTQAEAAVAESSEIRSTWKRERPATIALFVGKLIAKKRPSDLLHAVKRAESMSCQCLAVFVGAGELEPKLRSLASSLGVCVKFEGFKNQTQLPTYYGAADVLVLPSESETWGLVVNEAMACGIPAIVSQEAGCAPDMIKEGVTGYTYPVGDVDMLAVRMCSMAKRIEERHDFRHALAEMSEAHSLAAATDGLLRAIRSVRDYNNAEIKC